MTADRVGPGQREGVFALGALLQEQPAVLVEDEDTERAVQLHRHGVAFHKAANTKDVIRLVHHDTCLARRISFRLDVHLLFKLL